MRHLAACAVTIALAAACTSTAAAPTGLLVALCDAAAAPDVDTAREAFDVRAHQPLHELADELATVDRAAAAALLQSKFAVESAIAGQDPAPLPILTARLETLIESTREGLRALDRPAPAC